jgi:hypothetical protein
MTDEQTYTLHEAKLELRRRQCIEEGHRFDVHRAGFSPEPRRVICDRCGRIWPVGGGYGGGSEGYDTPRT